MRTLTTVLFLMFAAAVYAQKLPNVQQVSLRAPANVKVDGKPDEWDAPFKAYNYATDLYYTIANDDKNLYLVVQSTDVRVIARLIQGSINVTLQKEVKDKKADNISITFPKVQGSVYFDILNKRRMQQDTSNALIAATVDRYNKKIDDHWKFIKLSGKVAPDTVISVYNTDGISASAKFGDNLVFSCEFAVDLKYLKALSAAAKVAYHITVKGLNPVTIGPVRTGGPDGPIDEKLTEQFRVAVEQVNAANSPTDFWGEYTLAK